MTDVLRQLALSFGLHSTAYDYSSTPGTVVQLQPPTMPTGVLRRQRTAIDRPNYAVDGRRFAHAWGAKDLSPIEITLDMKGSSSTGGATTWQTSMDSALMLDSIFGAAAAASSGAATTCSGTAGATLTVTSGASIANGDMIVFSTSAGTFAREVTSGGGTTTLTLDRAASGTASGTVYRMARWNWSTSITDHVHGYIRAELPNSRTDFFGCAPQQLRIAVSSGIVRLETTWLPTDWDDVAEANPSFSEASAGEPIIGVGAKFLWGAVEYLVKNLSITAATGAVPRETHNGVNGVSGYVCSDKTSVVIEGELYLGDNAGAFNEIVDDSGSLKLEDFTGDALQAGDVPGTADIAIQLGRAAGRCAYLRLPAASLRGSVQDSGGLAVVRFQAHATAPASGSPFRLGIV